MEAPCVRVFSAKDVLMLTGTESNGLGATRTIIDGLLMHDAWHITWVASDRSTLSPSLPTLTSGKDLQTWVPGQIVAPGEGDGETDGVYRDPLITGAMWFGMVGVPILAVVVIVGVVSCCIVRRRKKRRGRGLGGQQQSPHGTVVVGAK